MKYWGWPTYFFILFLLLLIVVWEFLTPIQREWLECFVVTYQGTITAVGTIVLVTLLAFFTTAFANYAADRREKAQRFINAELKIPDFRQDWLAALREELVNCVSKSQDLADARRSLDTKHLVGETNQLVLDAKGAAARIILRLNPNEPEALELEASVVSMVDSAQICFMAKRQERVEAAANFVKKREHLMALSRDYLKNEWETLKLNLKHARR